MPTTRRKILLVDPIVVGHSLLYYQAALASSGFEEAQFTLAALVKGDEDRKRLEDLERSDERFKARILGVMRGKCISRWECWREFGRAMRGAEQLLREESFDLVVYLYLDLSLPFFALPVFRPMLRAHFQARPAGLIFRDNGLRPPFINTLGSRMRNGLDRWLLARALAGGGLRKVAFLDHWCAERAGQLFKTDRCSFGVDPVFYHPCDREAARAKLGVGPEEFVFLLFGTMSGRKGAVESLALLREADLPATRTAIIVAGPSAPETRDALAREVTAASLKYKVIRHDRFIENSELPPYFAAADCVVCVYKDFSGSSNVLIHAAIYGKLAMVSPGGAMEDAVRRHNFGAAVSLDDPNAFASAARKLAQLDPSSRSEFGKRALVYGQSMEARRFMSQFS